jgi:cytochrome P450
MMTVSTPQNTRPPGPGLFGSFSLFRDLIDGPRRMYAKHGNFVELRVALAQERVVLIHEPEWIEQVVLRRKERYHKDRIYQWLRPVFGDSILVSEGEKWKRNRRLMAPAFHRKNLVRYGETMVECADAAIERLEYGKPFALNRWMMEIALDIALRTLFGSELKGRASVISEAVDGLMHYADAVIGSTIPLPTWLPIKPVRDLKNGMSAINEIVDELIQERRHSDEQQDDLLGLLLAARDEDGSRLSDQEVREEVITLLLAGHETTALMLTYTVHLLCRFPYALEPIREQLDAVLGDRRPTVEDLSELDEVEHLVKESLRLYPPAGIIGREAIEEDDIGGYDIHVGDQVLISIWALHHDERFFDDPWSFDPSRWSPEMEKALPRSSFMPFGGGARTCIGDAFAMMEGRLVMSRLLQKLEFEALDASEPSLELAITMRPTEDIMVTARPRE